MLETWTIASDVDALFRRFGSSILDDLDRATHCLWSLLFAWTDSLVSLSSKIAFPCGSASTATNATSRDESVIVEHSSDTPLRGFELDEDDDAETIITADNLCVMELHGSILLTSGLPQGCWNVTLFGPAV